MRFGDFVPQVAQPVLVSRLHHVQLLASHVHGGWEGWLQIEFYLQLHHIARHYGAHVHFNREQPYPSGGISDFSFAPSNANGVTTWVELKTQKHGDFRTPLREFVTDCETVLNLQWNWSENSAGAMLVLLARSADALAFGRQLFGSSSTDVTCAALQEPHRGQYQWMSFTLNTSNPPIDVNLPVVLTYNADSRHGWNSADDSALHLADQQSHLVD